MTRPLPLAPGAGRRIIREIAGNVGVSPAKNLNGQKGGNRMGTTMTFYHIRNDGLDRERLQSGLKEVAGEERASSARFEKMMIGFMGEEMFRQVEREVKATQQHFDSIFGERPKLPSPMIGYRPDAAWLPFFSVDICEGRTASSKDARKLSKLFGVPVLALSIFDSDILFVSYSDAAKGVEYDFAKPPYEEYEEYDAELYSTQFPQFLIQLCPALTEEKLTEIWEADEVFADDRIYKLGEILGLSPINGEVPEGFEVITAD